MWGQISINEIARQPAISPRPIASWPMASWLRHGRGRRTRFACFILGFCASPIVLQQAASANAVTGWNQELQRIISLTSVNLVDGPPEVARELAIVTASMFDAVNAATGLSYKPYAYSGPAVPGVSAEAAALAAGYQAVVGIFNDQAWQTPTGAGAAATALTIGQQFFSNALNGLGLPQGPGGVPDLSGCASPAGPLIAVCGGLALGAKSGLAVLSKQANDGSQAAIINGLNVYMPPGSGTVPGVYIPPSNRPAMFPTWGTVTPLGLSSSTVQAIAAQTIPGPPAINTPAYANGLLLTECTGTGAPLSASVTAACAAAGIAPRTAAEAAAAFFWNDPGGTYQPPGHWLEITNGVIQSQNLDTLQAARVSMLVSIAQTDAGIPAWGSKYQFNLWRPTNAIQDCGPANDGSVTWNPHFKSCSEDWTSLIATPPHPDYVAGHPAFSGAAATVLKNFFHTDNIAFSSVSQSYCNGGTARRGGNGLGEIEVCTVNAGNPLFAPTVDTIWSLPGMSKQAACEDVGGVFSAANTSCTIAGTTFVWSATQSGCSDVVNGGANDSPLICPITENFHSFSSAANGADGSEFSRVFGGIHTPFAVSDSLALGNALGQAVSAQFDLPEPATWAIIVSSIVLLAPVLLTQSRRQRRIRLHRR